MAKSESRAVPVEDSSEHTNIAREQDKPPEENATFPTERANPVRDETFACWRISKRRRAAAQFFANGRLVGCDQRGPIPAKIGADRLDCLRDKPFAGFVEFSIIRLLSNPPTAFHADRLPMVHGWF
jgi:hypothetical protein